MKKILVIALIFSCAMQDVCGMYKFKSAGKTFGVYKKSVKNNSKKIEKLSKGFGYGVCVGLFYLNSSLSYSTGVLYGEKNRYRHETLHAPLCFLALMGGEGAACGLLHKCRLGVYSGIQAGFFALGYHHGKQELIKKNKDYKGGSNPFR